ncbi:hypothetical protein K438DRAFT_1750111 [Mycena galopus ATCC 62051]|nr:hypothetical protein K438DRAFT_1750111 [Mycena galopus ATCC 62051]
MLAARSAALECFIRFLNSPQASLWLQQVPWPILFEFLGLTYHHVTFGSTYTHSMLAARSTALECFIQFLNSPRASLWLQVPLAIFIRVSGGHTSSLYIAPRRIAPPQKFYSIFGVPATEISRPNLAADVRRHFSTSPQHPFNVMACSTTLNLFFNFWSSRERGRRRCSRSFSTRHQRVALPQKFYSILASSPPIFPVQKVAADVLKHFSTSPRNPFNAHRPRFYFSIFGVPANGALMPQDAADVLGHFQPDASIHRPSAAHSAGPEILLHFGVPPSSFQSFLNLGPASVQHIGTQCPLKLFFNFLKFPRVATLRAEVPRAGLSHTTPRTIRLFNASQPASPTTFQNSNLIFRRPASTRRCQQSSQYYPATLIIFDSIVGVPLIELSSTVEATAPSSTSRLNFSRSRERVCVAATGNIVFAIPGPP